MSNKEIRIKWLSDESEIDKSINNLQRKLQQINKTTGNIQNIQETGGQLSKRAEYAQKVFQRSTVDQLQKESREMEQRQKQEMQALLQKQRELNKMKKDEEGITEEKRKQLEILKEEINLQAKKVMDIETSKKKVDDTLKQISPQEGAAGGGDGNVPAGGGGRATEKGMKQFAQILRSLGVASVLNGAINFAQHRLERDRRVLSDQGQTAQMASRELREQMQGQGMRGMFFAQERQQAMQMAAEEQKGMRNLDLAKIGGGIATGALAGTAIPWIGNLAGAVGGGALAFAGMMGGSDRMYNRVFDQDAYRQMLTREGMQKYEANRAMLEMQDPMKQAAFNEVQQQSQRNVNLERSLGLGARELYGETRQGPATPDEIMDLINTPQRQGIFENQRVGRGAQMVRVGSRFEPSGVSPLRPEEGGEQGVDPMAMFQPMENNFRVAEAGTGAAGQTGFLNRMRRPYGTQFGFSDEDIQGSIQSLLGAGATTEAARGLSGQALQFNRNLRLQNAQQVMGQLSGAGMETAQTDDATIRLMAEAVKLGVDDSTMPQEMKRMTSVTAQLATQGGGFSATAVENFAAGLTGFSQSDIQGAQSAFEEQQQRSKQGGGFEGQMGMGFLQGQGAADILGKEAFGKLKGDSRLMNALNQLSTEDLEKDPAALKGFALKLGVDEATLRELVSQKDVTKQTRLSTQQDAAKKLGERLKGMDAQERSDFLKTDEGSLLYSESVSQDIAAFGSRESGKGAAERQAGVISRALRTAGGTATDTADIQARLEGKLQSDDISGIEKIKASQAVGDETKADAVNKQFDQLVTAAEKHTKSAELYNAQFERFVKFAKESGDALGDMKDQLDQVIQMMTENNIVPSSQASGD
jgi:hypothetical protein